MRRHPGEGASGAGRTTIPSPGRRQRVIPVHPEARSFAGDRAGRAALLVAAGAALILPRALVLVDDGPGAAGFRAGLEAGPGPGLIAGLWGIFLLAGVLVLWQGIVSSDVASGRFRTTLVRPVWRPGIFLARHVTALLLLAAAAAGVAALLWIAGGGAAPDPGGLLLASLLTGWTLGALLLLLSALLDRGDALAAVALFLAPGALEGALEGGTVVGAAGRLLSAALPPMLPLAELRRALLAGAEPGGGVLAAAILYGGAALVLALLRLHLREYRAG